MQTHPSAPSPKQLFTDPTAEATWKSRFTAAHISLPVAALNAPHRYLYQSDISGVWEVYAWDRDKQVHRQVTKRSHGTATAALSPDGCRIWWFNDTGGDELGSWVVEPFDPDTPSDNLAAPVLGVPAGYHAGLAVGNRIVAIGVSADDSTSIWISRDGKPAELMPATPEDAEVCALSRDESLLAIVHSDHGDSRHPALRVVDPASGETVADKWDGPGKGLYPITFSPVPGDSRLLVLHERRGAEELLIWDVAQDREIEITVDLPGDVVADWYEDGTALVIMHAYQARSSLYRYDLDSATLTEINTPRGTVGAAKARRNGDLDYLWSSAAHPKVIRTLTSTGVDTVLLTPPGHQAPDSVPLDEVTVPSAHGGIHVLISTPTNHGDGPLPTVFALHGGPHTADDDHFSSYRAAWIDAGYAVIHANYRGSTGYGLAWRDGIEGRPGLTELEDIAAVHDWAMASGRFDPQRCVIAGDSWGGYLVLMALGIQPQRWTAGIAAAPVADYITAYHDEIEQVRAFDRALFGGSPTEVPQVYRECSPISYVQQVTAPVLILAGENDPRCPITQIDNYLDELAKLGANYEVYRYDAGHGSLVTAEVVKQTAIKLHFANRMLGIN